MRVIFTADEISRAIRDQILGHTLISSGSTFDIKFDDDSLDYPIDNLQATVEIDILDVRPTINVGLPGRTVISRPSASMIVAPFSTSATTAESHTVGGAEISASDQAIAAEAQRQEGIVRGRGRPPGSRNKPKVNEAAVDGVDPANSSDVSVTTEAHMEGSTVVIDSVTETVTEAGPVARVSPFARLLNPTGAPKVEDAPEPAVETVAEPGETMAISTGEERVEEAVTQTQTVTAEVAATTVVPIKRSLFASVQRQPTTSEVDANLEAATELTAEADAIINDEPPKVSKSLFANLKAINSSRS